MVQYASRYPGQENKIIEYFKTNTSSVESIRGPILEEKVIESILTKSNNKLNKLNVNNYKKLEEKTFKIIKDQ